MVRSTPPARLLLLLVALPLLASCTSMSPFRRARYATPGAAVVDVRNDRWEDLTIYLSREGSLLRLGVVSGKGSTTLTVPEDYVRLNCTLRLVARTIGRTTQGASQEFGLGPGSRVTWHIPLTTGESPVTVNPAGWEQDPT
jgi:hypothetical protein